MFRTCKIAVLDIADKKIIKLKKDRLAKTSQPEIQGGKKKEQEIQKRA